MKMARMMSAPTTPQTRTSCWYSGRHAEVAEDQQEDEEIVDAQRLLDDVAGDELQRELRVGPRVAANHGVSEEVNEDGEDAGQTDPQRRSSRWLRAAAPRACAMEDAQIERQHRQHKNVEDYPEDPVCVHAGKPKQPFYLARWENADQ